MHYLAKIRPYFWSPLLIEGKKQLESTEFTVKILQTFISFQFQKQNKTKTDYSIPFWFYPQPKILII